MEKYLPSFPFYFTAYLIFMAGSKILVMSFFMKMDIQKNLELQLSTCIILSQNAADSSEESIFNLFQNTFPLRLIKLYNKDQLTAKLLWQHNQKLKIRSKSFICFVKIILEVQVIQIFLILLFIWNIDYFFVKHDVKH